MFSHSLMGLSCHPLLGLYLEQGVKWSGCFLKLSWKIRHSLAKQHGHFARGFDYAIGIDGDIQPQINCSVIIECPVANSVVHSAAPLDHGKIILKWKGQGWYPAQSASMWCWWLELGSSLTRGGSVLISPRTKTGILTDTHILHMNAQHNVSELFLIDLLFQNISIHATRNFKVFFNESFGISL